MKVFLRFLFILLIFIISITLAILPIILIIKVNAWFGLLYLIPFAILLLLCIAMIKAPVTEEYN